jgi:hypothetical protein
MGPAVVGPMVITTAQQFWNSFYFQTFMIQASISQSQQNQNTLKTAVELLKAFDIHQLTLEMLQLLVSPLGQSVDAEKFKVALTKNPPDVVLLTFVLLGHQKFNKPLLPGLQWNQIIRIHQAPIPFEIRIERMFRMLRAYESTDLFVNSNTSNVNSKTQESKKDWSNEKFYAALRQEMTTGGGFLNKLMGESDILLLNKESDASKDSKEKKTLSECLRFVLCETFGLLCLDSKPASSANLLDQLARWVTTIILPVTSIVDLSLERSRKLWVALGLKPVKYPAGLMNAWLSDNPYRIHGSKENDPDIIDSRIRDLCYACGVFSMKSMRQLQIRLTLFWYSLFFYVPFLSFELTPWHIQTLDVFSLSAT